MRRLVIVLCFVFAVTVVSTTTPAAARELRLGVIKNNLPPDQYDAVSQTDAAGVRIQLRWSGSPDAYVSGKTVQRCQDAQQRPPSDSFRWDYYDERFRELAVRDTQIEYVILQGACKPVAEAGCTTDIVDTSGCSPREEYFAQWKKFVRNVVKRYGPPGEFWADEALENPTLGDPKFRVRKWVLWNEPDAAINWNHDSSSFQYSKLLEATNTALKTAAGNDARMVGGNTTGTDSGYEFARRLYENRDARMYSDELAFHKLGTHADAVVETARRFGRINGGNLPPLSLTAFGWSVHNTGAHPKCVDSESLQAAKLENTVAAIERQVEAVTWMLWFNAVDQKPPGAPCSELGHYGFFTAETSGAYTPKVSLTRFNRCAPIVTVNAEGDCVDAP